jgi:CRISPR-associated endonuclease Csn1
MDPLPLEIIAAGVRCFEAGVEGDIEKGKDASRARERRQKRGARRQLRRRAARLGKLFRALQRAGLLPEEPCETPEGRHALLDKLDADLRAKLLPKTNYQEQQVFLYRLRARAALGEELPPFAVGRALYHLAQRRGFLSNRKAEAAEAVNGEDKAGTGAEEDKEPSPKDIKGQIKALDEACGAQTYGSFFAQQDPLVRRIRQHWLGRDRVKQEFETIWQAQSRRHPERMTETARKEIFNAIFFQRPLKSAKGLVGRCELVAGRRRSAQALLIAQRFRLLQMLNNLIIRRPGEAERKLGETERQKLHDALDREGDQTVAACRKLLALPRGVKFNYEEGGEKRLVGNRTQAKFLAILGERWEQLTPAERDQLTLEVLHYQKADALRKRLVEHWRFGERQAEALAEVTLEPGYAAHSRPALERLVEVMEAPPNPTYSEARKQCYPESFMAREAVDELPPVDRGFPDLRNPAVTRALTELRKVVNHIVRRYGRPEIIRIELARDLKKGRQERKRAADRAEANRKQREEAVRRILKELPDQFRSAEDVRKSDITKVLLAGECNWRCPFTDTPFGLADLLGANPTVDIAHLHPRRYLDDSFANLTLCQAEENRHRMGDQLPYDAYAQDAERWSQILQRVKRFQGALKFEKLRRFETTQVPEDFAARQLNDTRHASVKAADYLGMLFGGRSDAEGTQRIYAIAGGITAQVRRAWGLNRILGGRDEKNRDDHRQHAIDAIVLALTRPQLVGELQTAAARTLPRGDRLVLRDVPLPRPDFIEHVRGKIQSILVSHRVDHRLGGPLHAETNYSPAIAVPEANAPADGKRKAKPPEPRHHVRKLLKKLSEKEIEGDAIVDPEVRRLVQEKYAELGGGRPAKVFADPGNHPHLPNRHGAPVPIHSVRVVADKKPFAVGSGGRVRYVAAGKNTNHLIEIVAELDESGAERRWTEHLVTRREAYRRKAAGEAVVKTDWGPRYRFICSLFARDYFEWTDDDGIRRIYRAINLSAGDIGFRRPEDGRSDTDIKKAKERIRQNVEDLRKQAARKVTVTPLGEVLPCGG